MRCLAMNGVRSLSWAFRAWVFPFWFTCCVIAPPSSVLSAEVVLSVAEAPEIADSAAALSSSRPPIQFSASASPLPTSVLDGRMVACRAVRNWTPAKALRARGRTVVEAFCEEDECEQNAARSVAEFLNLQACHQEDIAAASALRAYYTRIALALQLQLCEESQRLVDLEENKHRAALNGGLATGVDISGFERRRLELEDQRLQLIAQDRQLRELLAQLADCDYETNTVQQERLDVQANLLDCDRLVSIALHRRYDIRSWNCLASQVNETSASVFARMISTAVGGFGLPLPPMVGLKNFLCPPDQTRLAGNLKRELCLTVETNRRWIQQTVMEKCAKLELAYRRMELAQQTTSSWLKRREQLEHLQELGKPLPEQIAAAQVGWIKSQVDDVLRRLEARLAEIELAEATGELSRRCCSGHAWLVTGTESALEAGVSLNH